LTNSYNAKKYFILGFKDHIKNEHKSLSRIHTPSIRELLVDYVEIHEDITTNLELVKLGNARNDLIEAMIYYVKNSIFYDNSLYKKEFSLLVSQMENLNDKSDKDKNLRYSHIYTICNSLIKKIHTSGNIYLNIVNLVKANNNFSQSEKAIHFIINELLYEGYSLKYLDVWYNENIGKTKISETNVDTLLNMFCELKQPDRKFEYFINVYDNKYFKDDVLFINFNLSLIKQDFEKMTLIDSISNQETKKYLQDTKGYNICSIQTNAKDYYKGLDNILNSIKTYFQMINYVSAESNSLFLEKIICKHPDGTYKKIRLKEIITLLI